MEGSEIALLRQRLVQEYEAGCWALYGLNSGTAQHAFITARFRQMETCHQRLTELVGEEQATTYLCEVFDRGTTPNQPREEQSMAEEKERSQDDSNR